MLLKKLQVQGYKTFANKTEFLFDEGITAIVGPNGSGKSNVADAVRWVLGEQSFSELRGKRTVDMIFAGSPSRPRAGMANAILTLDNSNGWLPIDYSEVEIGRRAYRSGENEYFLNGSRVRLKDVRELLATSGLAQRTYTMIGQGLIDRALSLKADERRALFEEAAGIAHYKARRAETLRRLNETQRNIERVHDVLSEIEPRLRSLKRQANRAVNYEQIHKDLRHLLRIWYGYQWKAAKEKVRVVRETAQVAEKAWKESRRKLVHFQEQMDDARKRLSHYREQINKKEAQRDSLREQLEHARRQVAILTERQSLVSRQLAEISAELPDLDAQQQIAQAELQAATTELGEIQQRLDGEQAQLAQFEVGFKAQQTEINRQQQLVTRLERDVLASQRVTSQAEGQLESLRERLAEREAEELDADEIDTTQQQIETIQIELKALQEESKAVRAERNKFRNERDALIRDLKKRRSVKIPGIDKVGREIAGLEGRIELLNDMRKRGTKMKGKAQVLGRVADVLTIPEQHRTAIEAALHARLETLLVPDAANLWQLVHANQTVSALAVSGAAEVERPAVADGVSAAEAVGYKEADTAVAELLLNPIVIVKDSETAEAVAQLLPAGCLAVSADGIVCHANGTVEKHGVSAKDSAVAQKRELQNAKFALKKKQEELAQLHESREKMNAAIAEKQREVDAVGEQERKISAEDQRLARQMNDLKREQDRRQQYLQLLQRRADSKAKDIHRLQQRIVEIEKSMGGKRDQIVTLENSLQEARVSLAALPITEAAQQRTQLQQQMVATKTIVDGRRAVADSRRATLGQIENRLTRQRQRLESLENQQRAINLEQEESRLSEVRVQMDVLDEELQPLRSLRKQIQGEISDIEADLSIYQKEALKAEENYTEARLAKSHHENHIENLRERIKSDLGIVDLSYDEDETVQTPLPMTEVVEKLPMIEELPLDIELSIQKRRGQLQRMGAINPDAPEEYEATKERYDFLNEQIDDLIETEKQLRKVIGELDELTSQEFAKTVDQVNLVFGEMFTRLFGGGSAELLLTQPDDLTVSGVDIMAQLPRRRTQGLGLLSGGERSLTAAALIFSLLKVTPPPFCMMDEVDAALDEANINRFRDVLREQSLKTQMIVITHNRGTVQAANTIYGISMGGDSASQVISIKPEDYVKSEIIE